ncbi:MerR family transcriptional regulator [Sphingosinicella humi]|uniref:MerR family transcriptional regulator n=1 Tax=Allosphingosinicella humi TaxID=2068657 RepID=A0A2U2J118_9SPHN|nr:helix-turn-helix domain-containing protein [Sphingosinicella humi]PWG01981.1 MerR family transcriptional regulator [Sphingosinicella humi]
MKIGELGAATVTKVETIRYYEQIGLLPPPARSPSNYRSYGPEHLQRLAFIRRARDLGFPLDQVRELLSLADDKDRSCEAVDEIARAHRATVKRKMAELRALGDELDRLIGQCGHGVVADCRIIEALADVERQQDESVSG